MMRYDAVWVVVDCLTHRAHFIPTTKASDAVELACLFICHIFVHHGLPDHIILDRGSTFVSSSFGAAPLSS
jgi:hypothetical protein